MPNIEPVADGAAIPGWAPVIEDPALAALLRPGAVLHRLATGATWAEGPVWLPHDGSVLWSDVVGNRVLRWDPDGRVSVFLADAEFENGHTLDHDGSIVACSHGHRRLERLGLDGTLTPIVDRYLGRRFNSPNDVVVKSDGTIWFTDPPYGITSNREGHQADSEIGDCLVFRFDPRTGELDAVTDWVDEPNGLAFSPDETVLYVSDTSRASHDDGGGNHHIAAFDVVDGRTLANPRVLLHRRRLGARRLPRRRRGQRLDVGGRRDPRRRAGRAAPRPAAGPGADRELRLRRPRPRSPVHHRVDVALRDRRGRSRRGPGRLGLRPGSPAVRRPARTAGTSPGRTRAPGRRRTDGVGAGPGLRSARASPRRRGRRRAGRGG